MRRFAIPILIVFTLVLLSACDDSLYSVTYPEPVIVHPDPETAHTINGYRDKVPTPSQTVSPDEESSTVTDVSSSFSSNSDITLYPFDDDAIIYVGNKTTKKFHLENCRYAKNMDSEKKIVSDSYNEAVNLEYVPCKICHKK